MLERSLKEVPAIGGKDPNDASDVTNMKGKIGNYKLDRGEAVVKQCGTNSYIRPWNITETELRERQDALDTLFTKGREEFKNFMKYKELWKYLFYQGLTILAPFLSIVLNFIFFGVYIMRAFCWIFGVCCDVKNKAE